MPPPYSVTKVQPLLTFTTSQHHIISQSDMATSRHITTSLHRISSQYHDPVIYFNVAAMITLHGIKSQDYITSHCITISQHDIKTKFCITSNHAAATHHFNKCNFLFCALFHTHFFSCGEFYVLKHVRTPKSSNTKYFIIRIKKIIIFMKTCKVSTYSMKINMWNSLKIPEINITILLRLAFTFFQSRLQK